MKRQYFLAGLVVAAVIALAVFGYVLFFGGDSTSDALAANAGTQDVTVLPGDITLGSPKAPVTMLEYAAPACPVCAYFNRENFPTIRKEYIDTGKVYYIFRVFPLSSVDLAAEGILRCLPKNQYLQFLDTLFRNQDKWDPDGHDIPDVHAALVSMARVAGMDAAQADKCMADPAQLARASKVGADASAQYGVHGTPTFIVNGEIHVGPSTIDAWRKLLDAKLARK
ncbi:MAG TPA: DsbA family protein [Rhizomicrobium sp.]|nr:DsbA family protein [Rhizomicrobium sp.]